MQCEGELYYHHVDMKWYINGCQLHNGDVFDVWHNEKWESIRLEYDKSTKMFYAVPYIPIKEHLKIRFKCG